jgi:hypothetical protein
VLHSHPMGPFGVARLVASCVPCYRAGLAGLALAWQWPATVSHWLLTAQ